MQLGDVPDGWFYAAFTWHKELGLKYYQNGTLASALVVPNSNAAVSEMEKHLMIGGPYAKIEHAVPDLKMFGLKIWKRAILEEEVKAHMNSGKDY